MAQQGNNGEITLSQEEYEAFLQLQEQHNQRVMVLRGPGVTGCS
jgi:hypothetical protein